MQRHSVARLTGSNKDFQQESDFSPFDEKKKRSLENYPRENRKWPGVHKLDIYAGYQSHEAAAAAASRRRSSFESSPTTDSPSSFYGVWRLQIDPLLMTSFFFFLYSLRFNFSPNMIPSHEAIFELLDKKLFVML